MTTATEIAMQMQAADHRLAGIRDRFNMEIQRMTLEAMGMQAQNLPRELPPFPPLPPDATPEDRAARDRQERFERLGITASPDTMSEADYKATFGSRCWFKSPIVKDQYERVRRVHHCPKCETVDRSLGTITASRFFVTFEDDLMQQFPALAHNTCHHCGFEEYYPMRRDPRRDGSPPWGVANPAMSPPPDQQLAYQLVNVLGIGAAEANTLVKNPYERKNRIIEALKKKGLI